MLSAFGQIFREHISLGHFIVDRVNIKNYILFTKAVAQSSSQTGKIRLEGVRFREK